MCVEVIDDQVNKSLNNILAQYKNKFKKPQVDLIKDECKQTIKGILHQLIDALCNSDSDRWFQMLSIS